MAETRAPQFPTWKQPDGQPLGCRDKIKVLNENLEEIREMAQDALEDAILMGCDERQIRQVLHDLMAGLENPYGQQSGGDPGVGGAGGGAGAGSGGGSGETGGERS